jgi:hypothetical protein
MTKHELGIWQKLTSESETNLEARIKFDNLINNKMNTQFKTLRGRRILIEVPVRKESSIKLSEKDEDALMYEAMKQWNRLTVYAIGDKVEEIAVGDSVYIPTGQLEHAEKVDIDGSVKLMFNEMDIAIIW